MHPKDVEILTMLAKVNTSMGKAVLDLTDMDDGKLPASQLRLLGSSLRGIAGTLIERADEIDRVVGKPARPRVE